MRTAQSSINHINALHCKIIILLLSGVLCGSVWASPDTIDVVGLLGRNKAVLVINGQQRVMSVGETQQQITLLAVDKDSVLLQIDGDEERFYFSERVGSTFSQRTKLVEQIYKDTTGMYRTVGSINSYPVNFLVDTGASAIAMNATEARRLGVNYLLTGEQTLIETASGTAVGYSVVLDTVSVGQIKLRNVNALVLEGSSPTTVLLGMSYLGRLNVRHEGHVMQLETK